MDPLYQPDPAPEYSGPEQPKRRRVYAYALAALSIAALGYLLFISAPQSFPSGAVIRIEKGSSLRAVSSVLKKENVIRSRGAFEFFVILLGGEKHIVSADYLFEGKIPVWEVARRISSGQHHLPPVTVTIPEGFSVKQIADTFSLKLNNFNKTAFLAQAAPKEGYLFPDTYFFLTDATEADVLLSMSGNFDKKIAPLRKAITASGKSEKDIITMSSVIEREAKGDDDREIISGILWKRIQIGMPLQVDAAPETYKVKGLPKNPIGNPGLEAIRAAISPKASPYLYYLHDKNGNIHYAKSFAEHRANISKYLGK